MNLGILLAFFCNGILKRPIDRHITDLMNGEYQVKGYSTLVRKMMVLMVTVTLFIMILYGGL